MYRIFDTSPAEFSVSWDSMLAQCDYTSLQRFHNLFAQAEATGGRSISSLKSPP